MNAESSSKYILGQINVRLLEDDERERCDELLERLHYLKSARVGAQLALRGGTERGMDRIDLFFRKRPVLEAKDDTLQSHTHTFLKEMNHTNSFIVLLCHR